MDPFTSAPAPMSGQGGPPPQITAAPGQGAPGNAFMGAGPAVGPQGPPGPQAPPQQPPTPEQIAMARAHITPVVDGLMHLLATPRGDLTKKSVFDAAAAMISKGAFPTPDSKQGLIGDLAGLPDDEMQLRQALNGMLIRTATVRAQIHAIHGPG